jgi:deoxyadenosine/deoxycytidine kinase
MPIICLEGASAVGKTTTAKRLAEQYNAFIVPEVNALLTRPVPEPPTWYLERQAERWAIAQKHLSSHPLVVLDGDVLQPIWYNWIYQNDDYAAQADMLHAFYRQHIERGIMALPDAYILLTVGREELRRRKSADTTRTRRNFESHLQLIEPQKQYFEEMARAAPGYVQVMEAPNVEHSAAKIISVVSTLGKRLTKAESVRLIDHLCAWLKQNKPLPQPCA